MSNGGWGGWTGGQVGGGGGGSAYPTGRLPGQRTMTAVRAALNGAPFLTRCSLLSAGGSVIADFEARGGASLGSVLLSLFFADGSEFTQGTLATDDIQVEAGSVVWGSGLTPPEGITRLNFLATFLSRPPISIRSTCSVSKTADTIGAYAGAGFVYKGATDRIFAGVVASTTGLPTWSSRVLHGDAAAPALDGAGADYVAFPNSASFTAAAMSITSGGNLYSSGSGGCGSSTPNKNPPEASASTGNPLVYQTDWSINTSVVPVLIRHSLASGLSARFTAIASTGFPI